MRVLITLLAFAFSLSAMFSAPRTTLLMLLLVQVTGASLQPLQVILLSKARISVLPVNSGKLVGTSRVSCLVLTLIGFCLIL